MQVDWNAARALWGYGYDTLEIAQVFGVPESYIYKNIAALYGEAMERAA